MSHSFEIFKGWIDAQEETSCWFRVFPGSNELRLSFSFSNSLLFEENAHWEEKGLEGRIVVFEGVKWLVYLRSNRGSGNRKLFPGYRKLLELSRQVREGIHQFIYFRKKYVELLSRSVEVYSSYLNETLLLLPLYKSCRITRWFIQKEKEKDYPILPGFFHRKYARDYAL